MASRTSSERTAVDHRQTASLLAAGIAAGPLYILVGSAQVLTRDGFDVTRHPLSLLSNGDLGWIQIANFLVSGALVAAGALGVRRVLHAGRAGTWGPILLAAYGAGLIGSGVFVADPGAGFPPGVPAPRTMTTAGFLHFVFGALAFYALIAACFVFARRFAGEGRRGWTAYSIITGVGFLVCFAGIASGASSGAMMLMFYGAVAWIWIWHTAVLGDLLRRG